MELQAQFLAQTWAKLESTKTMGLPDRDIYKDDAAKNMRVAMKENALQIPQFWMADYVGLMEEFARETKVTRNDSTFKGQTGPAFPSRYHGADTSLEAKEVVKEVVDIIKASNEDARFVAAAVFTGMQGIWNLTRKIESRTNTPGVLSTEQHTSTHASRPLPPTTLPNTYMSKRAHLQWTLDSLSLQHEDMRIDTTRPPIRSQRGS
ncbi:hypothetical protein P3342_002062 [Pyrenophora teres f. teres]|nr:hypothetical protein P3342_002062 [Pyrenophora teres f. teres]